MHGMHIEFIHEAFSTLNFIRIFSKVYQRPISPLLEHSSYRAVGDFLQRKGKRLITVRYTDLGVYRVRHSFNLSLSRSLYLNTEASLRTSARARKMHSSLRCWYIEFFELR